jgi:hypothetical protein
MQAVKALLVRDAEGCLRLLDQVKPGKGPAVHIEVEQDIVVTIAPDLCGIAVLRAEPSRGWGASPTRSPSLNRRGETRNATLRES